MYYTGFPETTEKKNLILFQHLLDKQMLALASVKLVEGFLNLKIILHHV